MVPSIATYVWALVTLTVAFFALPAHCQPKNTYMQIQRHQRPQVSESKPPTSYSQVVVSSDPATTYGNQNDHGGNRAWQDQDKNIQDNWDAGNNNHQSTNYPSSHQYENHSQHTGEGRKHVLIPDPTTYGNQNGHGDNRPWQDHGKNLQGTRTDEPHYGSQNQNYELEFKYHDYDQITNFLRTIKSRFPHLTHLYSIGKSVEGT